MRGVVSKLCLKEYLKKLINDQIVAKEKEMCHVRGSVGESSRQPSGVTDVRVLCPEPEVIWEQNEPFRTRFTFYVQPRNFIQSGLK